MKELHKLHDAALIILYQSGRNEVLSILVKRWHVQFCKLAFWYCRDVHIAKDIAQESWLVIFDKLYHLKDPNKFKSWAIRIVNHRAIDWIRKNKREEKKLLKLYEETPKAVNDIKEHRISEELHEVMKLEIAKLSQRQQTVLRLFYLEEYSLKKIAQFLDISIGTAKSRLFHAREQLKKSMKKYSKED